MSNRPSLDDYVDVAERIQDFKDAHPEGSLQTGMWSDGEWFKIVTVEGIHPKTSKPVSQTFIVYRAEAYRTPDDPTPGHGIAWEPFPGATPYTSNSELMNAETAAWGRAIIALGLVANRSLASRQEVRNRRAEQEPPESSPKVAKAAEPPSDAPGKEIVNDITIEGLFNTLRESGKTDDEVAWCLLSVGVEDLPENPKREDLKTAVMGLTVDQALRFDAVLRGEDDAVPGSGEAA